MMPTNIESLMDEIETRDAEIRTLRAGWDGWQRAALTAEAEARTLREKLEDIASREWRDEGGRIAAAIARDALGRSTRKAEQ